MRVKDAVSAALLENQGQYLSGAGLAREIGVSRNAVWKVIRELQEEGFPIESKKKIGYRLSHEVDAFTEERVLSYLHSRVLGRSLYVRPSVGSTNDYCRRLYETGEPHGTVVAANQQTAGKGQRGRSFCSPAGTGLYFSVLLRQSVAIQEAPLLTACAAVAVARAIDTLYGMETKIKWVNDLMLHGKKCCGILTEGGVSLESGRLEYAVIGIGINVRQTARTMPEALRQSVTSLEEEDAACHVCRAELLSAVLFYLEQLLPTLSQRQFLQEYRSRSCLIGKTVEVSTEQGETKKAAVLDISEDCGLVIRDARGNVETLHSASAAVKLLEDDAT